MGNFNPSLIDANKQVTKAFPAAGANHNSPTIDLGHTPTGIPPVGSELIVSIPAMAAHSDGAKNYIIKLQDSADDSSYADVDPKISITVIGIVSTGTPAKEVRFPIPSTCRRYVQLNLAVDSAGPTLTGTSVTISAVANMG
jgi:hypothetical protein